MKKLFILENYSTIQILLFIIFLGLVTPALFTITSFWEQLDFHDTGQIGDTIGGITAPFINGIGAVLVFVAFKAQNRANNNFEKLERKRLIQDHINHLNNESDEFFSRTQGIGRHIGVYFGEWNSTHYNSLGKTRHYLLEFVHTVNLIEKSSESGKDLKIQLGLLYQTRYYETLTQLKDSIRGKRQKFNESYIDSISEIGSSIELLEELLDITKLQ